MRNELRFCFMEGRTLSVRDLDLWRPGGAGRNLKEEERTPGRRPSKRRDASVLDQKRGDERTRRHPNGRFAEFNRLAWRRYFCVGHLGESVPLGDRLIVCEKEVQWGTHG